MTERVPNTEIELLLRSVREKDCVPGLEWRLIKRLARAVESLVAERDALQAQIDKLRAVLTDPPLRPATERVMKATRLLNHPDWKEWK